MLLSLCLFLIGFKSPLQYWQQLKGLKLFVHIKMAFQKGFTDLIEAAVPWYALSVSGLKYVNIYVLLLLDIRLYVLTSTCRIREQKTGNFKKWTFQSQSQDPGLLWRREVVVIGVSESLQPHAWSFEKSPDNMAYKMFSRLTNPNFVDGTSETLLDGPYTYQVVL